MFFIGLIKLLWDRALKPEHFSAGFRASGLFPVSREAIPARKLAPSIPYQTPPTSEPTNECTTGAIPPSRDSTSAGADTKAVSLEGTTLKLKCTGCGNDMTPVKLHVVAYFTKHIQTKQKSKPKRNNQRVKPTVYGEVLTRDEMIEKLEEEEREKEQKEAEKAAKKAERAAKKAGKEADRVAKKAEKEVERVAKKAEKAVKKVGKGAKKTQNPKDDQTSDGEEISKPRLP